MVRDIAAAVAGELSSAERAALASRPSSSPEAYDHFLRANHGFRARTPASMREAIREYGLAVARDPRFAEAVALGGYAHLVYLDWGWPFPDRTRAELLAAARSLAARAMEIDPGSPEVWLTQAYLRVLDDPLRHAGAPEAFARSLQLDPLSAEAHHQQGQTLMVLGRDREAIAAYHRALALEPGRPMTLVPIAAINSNMGARREAKRWIDSAMAVAGSVPAPYALAVWGDFTLGWGDAKAAESAARRALAMDDSYSAPALAVLAGAQARQGRTAEANASLARALATIDTLRPSATDARFVAPALLALGREDEALTLLERVRPRGAQLWFYLRSRSFDPVRRHPRFEALWRETDPRAAPRS
jgi:tetratricopeptide (TPR) repeat protein